MNEEERLEKQMKNAEGKRIVAYNAHVSDDVGIIWCTVVEDEAGYYPMTGRDELAAPWYLARFEHHKKEDGSIDYKAAEERAEEVADSYNWDNGFTRREVMDVVTSSMRASRW